MPTRYFLLLLLQLSGIQFITCQEFENFLRQDFRSKIIAIDSLILSHQDTASGLNRLRQLKTLAEENEDIQLQNIVDLYALKFCMNKGIYSDEIETRFHQLIQNIQSGRFHFLLAEAFQFLAIYYWERNAYAPAMESFDHAYEMYSEFSSFEFPHKADFLFEYGNVFYFFTDFRNALFYYQKLLEDVPHNEILNITTKINTLAMCYRNLMQFDSALYFFRAAEKIALGRKDSVWIAIVNGNMANIHFQKKDYDQAIILYERSIDINLRAGERIDAAISLATLAEIYRIKKENKKALELVDKSFELVKSRNKQGNYYIMRGIYPYMASVYAANGRMSEAYAFLDSAFVAKDSLAKQRNLLYLAGAKSKIELQKHLNELQEKEAELNRQRIIRNSFVLGFLTVLVFTVIFFNQKKKLKREKKRSDELLLNILPVETAEELKTKGTTEAKSYDEVTIMFTDFKNFTIVSENMSAQELVKEINYFYSAFDKIIAKHNIEKIKTIGDSYMCAGGLPVPNQTNAIDILNAAMEIQEFMEHHREDRENSNHPYFQIRIGIHTGPVVAGIVGIMKFAYDVWGDTVNVAAAMERSGSEGKINISGTTYELVKHQFNCSYRGKIPAKNKGTIDMYFVESKKST